MTKVTLMPVNTDIDAILIELALNLHPEDFTGLYGAEAMYTKLFNDPKYINVLTYIKFIVKVESNNTVSFISMNLPDIMNDLSNADVGSRISTALVQAVRETLPLIYNAIIDVNAMEVPESTPTPIYKPKETNLQKLINDHWKYIEGLLVSADPHENAEYDINTLEYIYKTSFEHGYKHALQSN